MKNDRFKLIYKLKSLLLVSIVFFTFSLSSCSKLYKLPENKGLRVSFIDVGQGDAILIEFNKGDKILIDGGEKNGKALTFLNNAKIKEIDKMLATHPHSDHIGGLVEILKNISVKSVYTNEDIATTPIYEEFLDVIEKKGLNIETLKREDKIKVKEIVSLLPSMDDIKTNKDLFLLFLNNDEIYLDLDSLSQKLNCKSSYIAEEKRVILEGEDLLIELQIDSKKIKVNEEEKKISNPPIFVSNKILIPLKDLVVKILYGNFDYSYNVKEVNVSYKGKKYKINFSNIDKPLLAITNGKIICTLPIRIISEILGAKVGWDHKERKYTIWIDEFKIEIWIDKLEVKVNDETINLPIPPMIINEKAFIPFSPILEAIGGSIEVDFDIKDMKAEIPKIHNLRVLNPPSKLFPDINNNSIVLKFDYNDITFLFSGDAEKEAENDMLKSKLNLNATILKLGHHGSSSSSTERYLNAITPEVAIYMAGKGNPYGHPHKEVLDRLEKIGVKVYGTDVNGSIVITTDGKSYSIGTER